MIDYSVKDIANQELKRIELSDAVFGREIRKDLLSRIVGYQLAARRSGVASTKGRSEIRGGGHKPYRQKGTGNARQGTVSAPQFRSGGVVFGPRPRDFSIKMLKKERRLALQTALSLKADSSEMIVLESLLLEAVSTKSMVKILGDLGVGKSAIIVLDEMDEKIALSSRNIPGIKVCLVEGVNAYDLLAHENLIVTESALKKIEEKLA
ncbi:MAG: 50S ribosomal protein L4 [Magnetococcales bacterium]|nr:50S ribosomal protein L4 [Magnetococcales bacterium]